MISLPGKCVALLLALLLTAGDIRMSQGLAPLTNLNSSVFAADASFFNEILEIAGLVFKHKIPIEIIKTILADGKAERFEGVDTNSIFKSDGTLTISGVHMGKPYEVSITENIPGKDVEEGIVIGSYRIKTSHNDERSNSWEHISKKAAQTVSVIEKMTDGKYKLVKRRVLMGKDLLQSVKTLFDMQEKVRYGFLSKTDAAGNPEPQSFIRIHEDGDTVNYAVFKHDGSLIGMYKGKVPANVMSSPDTAFVAIQNSARAQRPGNTALDKPRVTGEEPATTQLRAENIIRNNHLEMWGEWGDPYGHRWWMTVNPFPIWPNSGSMSDKEEPYHMTCILADGIIHQADMVRQEYLLSALSLFTSLNSSLSMGQSLKFRMGLNGWYYSPDKNAPKAGASQSQAHVHLVRFEYPIEKAKCEIIGRIGKVSVSVLGKEEIGTAIVLEAEKYELEALSRGLESILTYITFKGDSFNVFFCEAGDKIRIFIADKVKGSPSPYFSNEWAFSEFGKAVVVDAPENFYEFTQEQKESFRKFMDNKGKASDWVANEKKTNGLNAVNGELFKKIILATSEISASKEEIRRIAESAVHDYSQVDEAALLAITPEQFYSEMLENCKGKNKYDALSFVSQVIKLYSLYMCKFRGSHLGACMSLSDILAVLYAEPIIELRLKGTGNTDIASSDPLFLSVGHAIPAIYTIYHMLGLIKKEDLVSIRFRKGLPGHPEKVMTPNIVFMSSGSLGQGLGEAIGRAASEPDKKVYAVIGDGELQEGVLQEAIQYGGQTSLSNLVAIVDNNKIQLSGAVKTNGSDKDSIALNFRMNGWNTIIVNGHDPKEIETAFEHVKAHKNGPSAIILDTIMGKGVSFMEKKSEEGSSTFHAGQGALDNEHFKAAEEEILLSIKNALDRIDKRAYWIFDKIRLRPGDFRGSLEGVKQSQGTSTQERFIDTVSKAIMEEGMPVTYFTADLTKSSVGGERVKNAITDRASADSGYKGVYYDVGIREQMAMSMMKGVSSAEKTVPVFSFYAAMANLILEPLRMAHQDKLNMILNSAQFGFLSEMGGNSHTTAVIPYSEFIPTYVPSTNFEAEHFFKMSADEILKGKDGRACIVTSRFRMSSQFLAEDVINEFDSMVAGFYRNEPELMDKGAYTIGEKWADNEIDFSIVSSGVFSYFAFNAKKQFEKLGYKVRLINVTKYSREFNEVLSAHLGRLLPERGPVFTIWDGDRSVIANRVSTAMAQDARKQAYLVSLGPKEEDDANGTVREVMNDLGLSSEGLVNNILIYLTEKEKKRDESRAYARKSLLAYFVTAAWKAEEEDRPIIFGIDIDWIPGMINKGFAGSAQWRGMIQDIEGISHLLKKYGLNNFKIITARSKDLADRIRQELDSGCRSRPDIVVMATKLTLGTRAFRDIETASGKASTFFAEVETCKLSSLDKDKCYDVPLIDMIKATIILSSGQDMPGLDFIKSYDKIARRVVFMPEAREVDIQVLINKLNAERSSLIAA